VNSNANAKKNEEEKISIIMHFKIHKLLEKFLANILNKFL